MSEIIQTSFDYGELSTEVALELRLSAERIRTRMKRTAEDIVEIGKELMAARATLKESTGYGHFYKWLHLEFGMGESSAKRFMSVAERFPNISSIMDEVTPTVLYLLAAPSTPENVIEQVQSGEISPNVKDVQIAIADAKAQARIARIPSMNLFLAHQVV